MKNAFTSKEQYMKFREAFKKIAREKKVTGIHMVLLNVARFKDPFNGFSPITNPKKIASTAYNDPWRTANMRFYQLRDCANAGSVYYKNEFEKLNFELEHSIPEESWVFIREKIAQTKGK